MSYYDEDPDGFAWSWGGVVLLIATVMTAVGGLAILASFLIG